MSLTITCAKNKFISCEHENSLNKYLGCKTLIFEWIMFHLLKILSIEINQIMNKYFIIIIFMYLSVKIQK